MDVRCERCNTEYEFDDDRIAEDGVTVKCTTCGHVFAVKKAVVPVAVPVPPEVDLAAAVQPGAVPAGVERPKEWKVRQANGNVFTLKELTTLQKWIVEGKVQRDDEISLTGESWKRLGDIGELGAFFEVVDEAQRAARLTAKSAGPPAPADHGMTPPTGIPPAGPSSGTSHESAAAPGGPTYDFESFSFRQSPPDSRSAQFEVNQNRPPAQRAQEPAFAKNDPAQSFFEDDEALAAAAGFRKGPSRQLLLILGLVGVVLVGYLVYYFGVWRPAQNRSAASASSVAGASRSPQDTPSAGETPATPPARERAVADKAPVQKPAPGEPAPRGRADARAPPSTGRAAPESPATAEPEMKSPATAQSEPKSPAAVERERKSAATAEREPIIPEQLVPGRATTGTARSDSRALDESKAPSASAAAPDAGLSAPTVARAEPRTFDFYMGQGDKLREREQPKAALEAYRKAAELEPGRAEPIAGRALALLDLGQKLQAQVWFQQALKLNPTYGVALMGLAEAYRADGKTSDAIRYYEKYLEVLPDGPEASVARSAIKNLQEQSRD